MNTKFNPTKDAQKLINAKIDAANECILNYRYAKNTAIELLNVLKKYDNKVFNAGTLKKFNADLSAARAPFSVELYRPYSGYVAKVSYFGTKLQFIKDGRRVNILDELVILFTGDNTRISYEKSAAAVELFAACMDERIKHDEILKDNYLKMHKPLTDFFQSLNKLGEIQGSAYLHINEILNNSSVLRCFYPKYDDVAKYTAIRLNPDLD